MQHALARPVSDCSYANKHTEAAAELLNFSKSLLLDQIASGG